MHFSVNRILQIFLLKIMNQYSYNRVVFFTIQIHFKVDRKPWEMSSYSNHLGEKNRNRKLSSFSGTARHCDLAEQH